MNRSTYARLCRALVVTLLAPLISFAPSIWAPSALPQARAASCASGGTCSIGDTGPGGGVVFYVAPTNFTEGSALCSFGCKYLEAAPITGSNGWSDFSTNLWGGTNSSVSGTGTAIGTGYANTAAIVAASSTAGKAATASTAYRGPNAKSDWFLPSKDELTQMWNQRAAIGIPTGGNWYWSSSQSVSCCAYVLKFDANATSNDFNKSDSAYVRPIRAFYPYQVPGSISITKTGSDQFGGYTGNDYINFNFPAGHGLNDARSFTIETWVWLGSSNTYGTVSLTAGDTTAAKNEYWKIRRSGFLINPSTGTWFAEGAGTAYCNPTNLTHSILMGQWVNLAYQRSIVSGTATDSIYIDGVNSGTCVVGTSNTNNDTIRIGTTSGYTGTYNTSYFGPTRVIDGEAIYSANFTPSTTFGAYSSNSSGAGITILNLAPTSTVPLTFAETPPFTPTLDYGASYLSSNPTYGSSDKSPPIYSARTLTIDSSSYVSSYPLGSTGPTISATASAGTGTRSYSASPSSVCSAASNGLVTLIAAGTCSVTAQIANDGTYSAATSSVIAFTVTAAVPTLSLSLPSGATTATYGTPVTITATMNTAGSVTFKSGGTAITGCSSVASAVSSPYTATCSWTPTAISATTSLTADFAPTSTNYSSLIAAASTTINVGLRPITVTATAAQSKIFGTTDPTLAYSITSGSLYSSDALSGSLARAAGESVGNYAINIGTLANSKYNITFGVATNFSITTANQAALTFATTSYNLAYGSTQQVTATGGSGAGAISYSAGSSTACSVGAATGIVTISAASGTCSITATRAADTNYNSVTTSVPVTITVGKGALSVSFGTMPSGVTFGEIAGTHQVSSTSTPANTGSIVFASTTSAVCTVNSSTGSLTIVSAGTCSITANDSGTSNYSAATQVTQSFSVSKATPVLSGFSIPNQNFGVSPVTITAPNVTPNIAGAYSYTSGTTSVGTISGSTLTIVSGGSSIITATFTPTDTANYNLVQLTTTLNVGTSSQNISISSTVPANGSIGTPTYTPTATAPGGSVAITLDATSTGCSLSGGSITFASTGNCLINFNQAGNSNYGPAPSVQQSINQYVISCSVSGSFYVTSAVIPSAAGQNCSGIANLPIGITGVAINAFAPGNAATQTNRALTGLVFPSTGFVNIDQGGFENLGLTSVTVPATVTVVGQYAFQNNPLATAVITGGSGGAATYLGPSIFSNKAYGLGLGGTGVPLALTFGNGNIQVGQNFGSNTAFASVDFGTGLTSIDVQAFKQNGISNWAPVFPATVTSIGQDAFTYSTIKNIKFGTATTLNLTSISPYAFDQGSLTSVQDCEAPSATTVLHTYLHAYQPQAVIWCNAVVPNPPNNLAATASSGTVSLTWSNGASQNEAPTTDFTIQYKLTGGSTWSTFAHTPSSTTSIAVTGLTNGVSYTFQIAAVNLIGVSPFSSTIQAKPLGVAFSPQFDIPVSTVDGFTVNVTNFDPTYVWDSATVTSGSVTSGVAANGKLPLTVIGMSPGSLATLSITASKQNYSDGTNVVTGRALQAALVPVLVNVVVTTGGLSATISNFNTDYIWSATASPGTAAISATGAITVTGVNPQTQIRLTVGTARSGYAAGSESTTATTLQLLQVIYNGSNATGGAVPVDANRYTSSAVATVLGNTGALSLSGNTFVGWTTNSNGTGQIYVSGNSLQLASSTINLYAKWTLNPYTVTYNGNNATSGTVPIDLSTYTIGQNAPVYGNTGGLTRTGYTFGNWGYNSTETSTIYASGQIYSIGADNVNLYAIWTPNTYTITYDSNGGTGSPSKTTDSYTTGSSVISLAAIGSLQKVGYNFVGWGQTASSNPIADGGVVTTDTRLYAQWRIANFAVTYLVGANGSGTAPHQDNVNFGSSFTVASAAGLTASDSQGAYAFVSWMDGSGKTYAPGQSYLMGANSVTLTAQWTRIYNVKYSFNGGSVGTPIADQQKISGDTITVTSVHPSRDGFTFTNWIDQSGLSTSAGETYTVNDNHYLLYAQWTAISYPVTYDSNGGNPTPTEPNHVIGDIFTVAAAPTRNGYDFAYWSEGSNHYNAGGTYQVGSHAVALQAQWTPQVYRISYDFNGGVGTSLSPTDYTYGNSPATLPAKPASDIARTDYTFSGWSSSPTATTGSYAFTPSGNVLLHAVWVSSIYRLTFNAGSGFSDTATAKVTIGQGITLPSATRANYTLLGWSTQQSGGNNLNTGATYTPSADTTLFAQWTLQVFTVTFDGNHGTPSQATATMTYGSLTPIVLPTATRSNYIFNGWYSDPSAGYLLGAAAANYSPTSSITAYAHWVQGSLNGMGAATQIAQVTVHSGIDSSFTAGSNGSTVAVNYTADSLPDGTVITAYLENSTARATFLLGTSANTILSLIIAWVATDGTVPITATGKPITMIISNSSITAGSKVYGLLGNTRTLLGIAGVDGVVVVEISEDPAVVVAIVGPDAPTGVTATAIDQSSATLSWTAPSQNGGSAITGYTATSSAGQSCQSSTTSCAISGLTAGTAYTFTVVATNAIGNSAASTASASFTIAPPVVTPPVVTPPSSGGGGGYVAPTPAPVVTPVPIQTPVDNSAAVKAAQEAAAKALAEKQVAEAAAKALAEQQAADVAAAKAAQDAIDAAILKAAQEKMAADAKALADAKAASDAAAVRAAQEAADASAKAAAVLQAAKDAADAAAKAALIKPAISLYSISSKLTLSTYDTAYLQRYVKSLKNGAAVTCLGYIYKKGTTLAKATTLARNQATAVCTLMKKFNKTLKTSILLLDSSKAPKAAIGAKWVAVSYRVDGFKRRR